LDNHLPVGVNLAATLSHRDTRVGVYSGSGSRFGWPLTASAAPEVEPGDVHDLDLVGKKG
jgi:hypothetical protein